MPSLVYLRLIGFTAGTLLQLFWMVVILGYRRQRNFERVFFFLSLALFFFYAKRAVLLVAYVPVLYFALRVYPLLADSPGFDFLVPGNALGRGYGVWLALAMLISAGWELRFHLRASDRAQSFFHSLLAGVFSISAALVVQLHVLSGPLPRDLSDAASTALALVALLPSAVLIYMVQRFNFLQIGRQKNLVYAVSATFLALLYLSLVRRLSGWLAPHIPPEATAAILLFVLGIFFEPLQRLLGRRLQETAHQEMGRGQRLMAEIQQEARQGNEKTLARFVEKRVKETFELAAVRVTFHKEQEIGEHHRAFAKQAGTSWESFAQNLTGRPCRGKHGRRWNSCVSNCLGRWICAG